MAFIPVAPTTRKYTEDENKKELNGNMFFFDDATNHDDHIKIVRLINEPTSSFRQIVMVSNLSHQTQNYNEINSLKIQIHENNNGEKIGTRH